MSKFIKITRRILKILLFTYIILLIISPFISGCFSFRLSQKEIDKQFAGKAIAPVQHQIKVDGHTINYAEAGNDSLPAVIFLHGSPGSWSAFVEFFKDDELLKKVKLVSIDRPGFGYSDFGEGEKSLIDQSVYLKPIVAKYKALGKKVILVGHSLGGPLIARMAMDYPNLIDNLIIVAGSIDPDLEPYEKWFRIPMQFTPIGILVPKSFRASNTEILYLKSELKKMLPLWKNITQPVTVIQGGKDILVDPKNAEFAKRMLINSKVDVVYINKMNHFVPWSNPELIKQAILKALQPS